MEEDEEQELDTERLPPRWLLLTAPEGLHRQVRKDHSQLETLSVKILNCLGRYNQYCMDTLEINNCFLVRSLHKVHQKGGNTSLAL